MTLTLYRDCPTCGGNGDVMTPSGYHDQCPVCSSWGVVRVKPDYEAAEQRAKNIMLYIVSNPQMSGDEFDINVDTLVREILDAALGIGDNHE